MSKLLRTILKYGLIVIEVIKMILDSKDNQIKKLKQ